jgi:hypothetical protein
MDGLKGVIACRYIVPSFTRSTLPKLPRNGWQGQPWLQAMAPMSAKQRHCFSRADTAATPSSGTPSAKPVLGGGRRRGRAGGKYQPEQLQQQEQRQYRQ